MRRGCVGAARRKNGDCTRKPWLARPAAGSPADENTNLLASMLRECSGFHPPPRPILWRASPGSLRPGPEEPRPQAACARYNQPSCAGESRDPVVFNPGMKILDGQPRGEEDERQDRGRGRCRGCCGRVAPPHARSLVSDRGVGVTTGSGKSTGGGNARWRPRSPAGDGRVCVRDGCGGQSRLL